MTPFGGVRVLARYSQGLLGQSEKLDKLILKILKDKLAESRVAKIQDYLVIIILVIITQVLHKFHIANLKVKPLKTNIFLQHVDIEGWILKKGGFLEVSFCMKNFFLNAKDEHINKVQHRRSLIILYKTLHMATLAISQVLSLLKDAVSMKKII